MQESLIRPLTRRSLTTAGMALLVSGQARAAETVASIEARHGGRLGVFVLDTGSRRMLAHRADARFLLCSTFKGVLAAMVLSRVDAGSDHLASLVPYTRRDLVGHAPVTAAHVAQGALSVEALCSAILIFSDNTAANLLLARVGGPAALTAYVRTLGDIVTRFDRYELAAGERSGVLDTTTPRAIAETARTLVLGDALTRPRATGSSVGCRATWPAGPGFAPPCRQAGRWPTGPAPATARATTTRSPAVQAGHPW